MSGRGATTLTLWFFLALAGHVCADVEIRQLGSSELANGFPNWSQHEAIAGDVLARTDSLEVVILTVPRSQGNSAPAFCLVTQPGGGIVTYKPGPQNIWRNAELAHSPQLGIVRFRADGPAAADSPSWRGELQFRILGQRPTLEIITTISNTTSDKTLEFPIVDELLAAGNATNDNLGWFLTDPNGQTVALLPSDHAMRVHGSAKEGWLLGFLADDPQPNVFRRISNRLPLVGGDGPLQPFESGRNWHRRLRDTGSWHRIPPGGQRTVTRRLVMGNSLDNARALARGPAAPPFEALQPLRDPTAAPQTTPASTGGRIIGKLRGAGASQSPSLTQPASAPRITLSSPVSGESRPAWSGEPVYPTPQPLPPAVELLPSPAAIERQTTRATIEPMPLPATIEAIADLPPPTP